MDRESEARRTGRREETTMLGSRVKRGIAIAGVAAAVVLAAACGGGEGGGKDQDLIKARASAYIDHINKADAKAFINDFAPDQRKTCDERNVKAALDTSS